MQRLIRRIKAGVSVLLVAATLFWNAVQPNRAMALTDEATTLMQQEATATQQTAAGPDRQFEKRLQHLKESVRGEVENRKADRPGKEPVAVAAEVAATRADLAALDQAVRDLLNANYRILQEKGAPQAAFDRHQSFLAEYEVQLQGLQQALAAAESAPESLPTLEELLDKLRSATPSDRQQPLGADLPFRPAPADPMALPEGDPITPAYASGVSMLGATAAALASAPADLGETAETRQTPAIKELAASLGNDPVAMFEYVRNTIVFTPYGGSRKGAGETLAELSGNAWDQASLLIALLRSAGYPARYVTGTVEVPAAAVTAWTGTQSVRGALELLNSSGVAATGITGGGDFDAVRMEHVWVEALVPLDDYRGVQARPGEYAWQPFDPSYKAVKPVPGLDIPALDGLDPAALIDQARAGAHPMDGFGSITNIDEAQLQAQIDTAYQQVLDYLTAQGYDLEHPQGVISHKAIDAVAFGIAPLTLPYRTAAVLGEYSALPARVQEKVAFGLSGASFFGFGGVASKVWEATTAELAGKRITLSWRPATADDAAIIAAYGGIFKTPPYLVRVTPELKLDGQVMATGPSLGLGQQQTFTMWFTAPATGTVPVENAVVAGSYFDVALDLGAGSQANVDERAARLTEVQTTLTEQNVWSDEALGEVLHLLGQAYFAQVGATRAVLANAKGIVEARHTSAGLVAADLSVGYLFFAPVSVALGGMHIDVDHDLISAVANSGDRNDVRGYMIASGAVGSAFEHLIFEQMTHTPSVSAMKVLALAQQRGVPVYSINAANVDDALSIIHLSEAVESDIRSAALSAKIIFAPEREIEFFKWKGAGYVIMDPDTGAAGYMISGGFAGGSVSLPMLLATIIAIVGLILMLIPFLNAIIGLGLFLAGLSAGVASVATVIGAIINAAIIAATLWYAYDLFSNGYDYWVGGDEAAGRTLVGLALGTLFGLAAGALAGKAIGALANKYPWVGEMLGKAFAWLDAATYGEASRLITRGLTREIVLMAAETSGPEGIRILGQLGDEGFITFDEMADLISRGIAAQDLNTILRAGIRNFAEAGIASAQDARVIANLLKEGFLADDVLYLANRGINASNLGDHGIFSTAEAQSALNLLRNGAAAQDLRALGGAGVKVSQYAQHGIQSLDDLAGAARLVRDFGYDSRTFQRAVRLVDNSTIEALEATQRAYPAVNLKVVLGQLDGVSNKFTAEVGAAKSSGKLWTSDMLQRATTTVRDHLSQEELAAVLEMKSYNRTKGTIGEIHNLHYSQDSVGLRTEWPGPVIPAADGNNAQLDLVAFPADDSGVVIWEARNYSDGSLEFLRNYDSTSFTTKMTQDLRRFEAARTYYQNQGYTDIYPTYFFADDWDPIVGQNITRWFGEQGWSINIIHPGS